MVHSSHWSILLLFLLAGSAAAQTTFVERSAATGTSNNSFGRGSAFVDLDGDGMLDLVNANSLGENAFYQQKPGKTFFYANTQWGLLSRQDLSWSVVAADFDNDGDADVYFGAGGSGAQEYGDAPTPNQFLRNDINVSGVFTDISQTNGASGSKATFGTTAVDYDRDGYLDIFLSNKDDTNTLYHNDGGLMFTDVSNPSGVLATGSRSHRHCGVGDIDNDGWLDLGAADYSGKNVLYRNQGDGTFTNIAASAGVEDPIENFGMVFQDYDNDGWQDIYIPKYQIVPSAPSRIYMNQGDLTFVDAGPGSGLGSHTDMGHDSGDIDSDGYPDLFIGTGNSQFLAFDKFYRITPNGNGGIIATDLSVTSGINSAGQSRQHGIAMGDYDRDGDIDVYGNNGGPSYLPGSSQTNFFWENQGNGNGWLALNLTGVLSNRTAVGTRTVSTTPSGRQIHTFLTAGRGFGNTPSAIQHVGLGSENQVDRVDITWPSGITQTLISPATQAEKAVTETGILVTGTPAIGTSVTFDFVGPPSELVDFNLALTQTSLQLSDIDGLLELGAPITKLLSFTLDAQGRASFNLPIPNNPNLIGLTAYLQAWIRPASNSGGTFTNTLAVTIE